MVVKWLSWKESVAGEPECMNGSPMSNWTDQLTVEAKLAQSMGTAEAESSGVSVLSLNILDPPPRLLYGGNNSTR